MARFTSLLPTLVFVILGFNSYGQGNNMQHPWRKRVSRYINMQDTARLHHTPGRSADSMLISVMLNEVMSGRVTVYNTVDNNLEDKLTTSDIKETFFHRSDTFVFFNPKGDSLINTYVYRSIDLDSVYEYKLLEDWTFDPVSGKTTIQIAAIAPVMKIFDDGVYRVRSNLFWMKFNDAIPIIQHYETIHLLNKLTDRIWQDYFSNERSLSPFAHAQRTGSVTKNFVMRTIDLNEAEDTVIHHLRNSNPESTLTELFVKSIKDSSIQAWKGTDSTFSERLSLRELSEEFKVKTDTDFNCGVLVYFMQVFNYDAIKTYRLLETWRFDVAIGRTEIDVFGIAPQRTISHGQIGPKEVRTLFWLRYNDVKEIIAQYEEYHPDNTIASRIWNDYFKNDAGPVWR